MGIEAFAWWQLFMFYTSYGGFLHLGLNDGIYLKIGGKKYEELNYNILGTEYKYTILGQIILCILISFYSYFSCSYERFIIILLSCICIIINNSITFFGYILLATNHTKLYSISLILEKTIYISILLCFLFYQITDYLKYIIFFILARLIALIYCSIKTKEVILSHILKWKAILNEIKINIKIGSTLTLANIAGMLILGIGRFFTDQYLGLIEFGKLSFSIMLTNFFLVFMSQISLVLFPALRKINEKELPSLFLKFNTILTIFSPIILLLYPFISIFITHWLPSYADSLIYLIFLLPLTCYDAKMQMINNTFLKVSRKEKAMLFINIAACIISVILSFISVYYFKSITLLAIGMLLSIAIRSILAEVFLGNLYSISIIRISLSTNILYISFLVCFTFFKMWIAFFIYSLIYFIYLLKNKKTIFSLIRK